MPTDFTTALLAAKSQLAALRVIHALQHLIDLTSRKVFNPGQIRRPAGETGGGRWAKPGDGGNGSVPGDATDAVPVDDSGEPPTDETGTTEEALPTPSIGGDTSEQPQDASRRRASPTGTPAQEARLAIATGQAQQAVNRVMESDPTWRGPASFTDGIESQIAHQDAMAEAANARLAEIARSGIGGNGPPSESDPFRSGTPGSIPFRDPLATGAYRNNYAMPDGRGTVVFGEIDGKSMFGVNSLAPGYTADDRADAEAMRKVLLDKYPEDMATNNIGWKPNDALYHAEATALFRAARENGGSLYGRTINLYGDREICGSCDIVLPLLSRELGNPTISFRDFKGNRSTLRNGF